MWNRLSLLTTPSVATLAIAFCVGAMAQPLRAQAQPDQAPATPLAQPAGTPLPSFEVASIKPHPADNTGRFFINMGCGPDPGRCTPTNATPKMLIEAAYDMKDFQVSGGPSWINSERFDIAAKVEDSLAEQLQKLPRAQRQAQMRLMMQSLLADRFKLKVTHQTQELPVYALVVAKGGPKLTEVPPPDPQASPETPPPAPGAGFPTPSPGGSFVAIQNGHAAIKGNATPIADLVNMLSQQLHRQILDQTGLNGTYTFTLQFTPETDFGGGPLPVPPGGTDALDSGGTSIFTAIQEQLGLRLESTNGPVDTIVIDQIEEPSPN